MTGNELKSLREECGLTQAQLAKLSGVNPMYLSQIERGAKPLTEKTARLLQEILSKASEMDAITIHNIDAKGSAAIAVGRGAVAKTSERKRREEVPDWARQLQESMDTTNKLLLKILERMG